MHWKRFLLSLLFFASSLQAYTQSDTDLLQWYNSLLLSKNGEKHSARLITEAESRLHEAVQAMDLKMEARERKNLALIHLTKTHNYDLATDHLVRSLTIEDSLSLHHEKIFTYLALAEIFNRVSDFHKSAGFLEQASALNHQFGSEEILVKILNDLGKVNAASGYVDDAFDNYKLVLEYEEKLDDPRVRAEALFNIAHLYTAQNQYDNALENFKLALTLFRGIEDRSREAQALNDIAGLYVLMKNFEKAMANHKIALEIRLKAGSKSAIAESYNNIGMLYFQQGNLDRALANLQLGLDASREAQDQNQMRNAFEYMSLCHRGLGDFKKALEFKESQLAMMEFIQSEKNQQQLAEKQNRYEIGKREDQILRLDSIRKKREGELREQKRFRNFLFTITGLIVIVLVLTFFLYLLKRRSNKALRIANEKVIQQNVQLQDLNATKDKFFSIISHDLKGPLNSLTSFSSLLINHTDNLSKDEIRMLAKDLDKSLKNLFTLLENLLEWSRSQTGNIDFHAETFDVSELLKINKDLLTAQASSKNISIQIKEEIPLMVSAHKHSINTVIRNLISNAIKFTPPGGTIYLSVKSNAPNMVAVSIADTGVGMSSEIQAKLFRIDTKHSTKGTADEKGTGLGLILCKEFVEKNGGLISVESMIGKGSIFSFTIPAVKNIQLKPADV